jgi:hypothetical protein
LAHREINDYSKLQQNTFSAPARTAFTPYRPERDNKKSQPKENRRKIFNFTPKTSPLHAVLFPPNINAALLALYNSSPNPLRQNHPVWQALLVAGFLHPLFIVSNMRILSQTDLMKAVIDAPMAG